MEYKIRANNQKEAVEVYKAIRQIQQGKHNIAVNADSRKDAVRIYKEAKRVCDSKLKDVRLEKGDWFVDRNDTKHTDLLKLYKVIDDRNLSTNGFAKAIICETYVVRHNWDTNKFTIRKDGRRTIQYDAYLKLTAVRFNSAEEALNWLRRRVKIGNTNKNPFKDDTSFKSSESPKQGKLATDSKNVKDSDKLKSTINNLINYIKSINNATKGKKERYYITDCIIQIQKELINEFNAISHTKNVQANKISMRASIRQMSGYFGSLIKELEAKSKVVNDLTLSQFLHQQANELNSWKQKHFI